ncbi:MAG: four helix bundle protein [Salinivirgaceae bacterium]|nr:four helix bundle protein [Salinivirgaceae bacterium]
MSYLYGFEKLDVWHNARSLAKSIYLITNDFPNFEKYGLSSQIQRAAISISSNIAEGIGRTSAKEQKRFVEIAYGSLMETLSQLYLAVDLEYIKIDVIDDIRPLIETISYQLSRLRKTIDEKIAKEKNNNL